jgi:phosphate starvation-inducible PhoH-like protein
MEKQKKALKNEIKYAIQLNEEQKEAKRLIRENQIVVITGRAGCGKSLISAQVALDFLFKKEYDTVFVTRAAVEVGNSLGFLPGTLGDKFDPYLEAFQENLFKCYEKTRIEALLLEKKIVAYPVQFIRGKTVDNVLIVEEAQNLTKAEMLAVLTRLGKNGKIIINGDNEQQDTRETVNGLKYVIELSKKIEEIKWIKLKENHRSDLVGKILNQEYGS